MSSGSEAATSPASMGSHAILLICAQRTSTLDSGASYHLPYQQFLLNSHYLDANSTNWTLDQQVC
jgi:hypothetical protein